MRSYENQIRASKTLMIVVPLALFIIFLILYFQFKRASTTTLVFSGIPVAWAGGLLTVWLYAQSWLLDFSVFSQNLRDLFQVPPINLSVTIWVGFLALISILTSTGRGSDIMVLKAIPSFGGMSIEVLTMLVVPVLYSALQERKARRAAGDGRAKAS